jgi:hypothetical protein
VIIIVKNLRSFDRIASLLLSGIQPSGMCHVRSGKPHALSVTSKAETTLTC